MIIFYLTIPLMLFAIGIATAPLLWAMKRQVESETRSAVAERGQESQSGRKAATPQVSDVCTSYSDVAA